MVFNWCFDPTLVFFFEMKIFSFPKKFTSVGWSSCCNFFWNSLDPTLVIFLTFFEKKYNDWIKTFYKSKWTGLVIFFLVSVSLKQLTFSYTLPNKHLIGLTFNKKNEHVCEHDRAEKYLFLYAAKEEKIRRFFGWCAQFLVMVHTVPKKWPINMKNKNFTRLIISKRVFLKSFFPLQ